MEAERVRRKMRIKVTPQEDLQKILDQSRSGDVIELSEGEFRQKIEINVDGVTLEGHGEKTVLVWDDFAKKLDQKGVELNTFRTYTVAVCAKGVTLRNLCVKNDAKNSPQKGQEVALSVCGGDFVAERCRLESEQDTLFCAPLPDDLIERYDGFLKDKLRKKGYCKQLFAECEISGTVDFVFGCADALFWKCKITSVADGRVGFVAAPAHAKEQKVGFVFDRCQLLAQTESQKQTVFLARPWRDYGKATFVNCSYGSHVKNEGFDKWNDTNRDKTARFAELGEKPQGRVEWSKTVSEKEAEELLNHFDELKSRLSAAE